MISIQIAMWRMAILIMFLLFVVVVVLPAITAVMARFAIDKSGELFST
jgi:hypothetical protein